MALRKSRAVTLGYTIESLLISFPVVCFTLALVTDILYWRTSFLMWTEFSSWLLFFGLVVGAVAALVSIIGFLVRAEYRTPLFWPYALSGALVLILAIFNSFVHSADGWTSVVPVGLALSAITVVVMLVTGWFGFSRLAAPGGRRHG
jgi:uncharacterized membrane protein